MSQAFNADDYRRLDSHIERLVSARNIQRRSDALVYLFLRHRFYLDDLQISECLTDGGNDCGIDAVFIDHRRDEPHVHLFQSKVYGSEARAANSFSVNELDKIARFFEIVRTRGNDLAKIVNRRLEHKVLELRELGERAFPDYTVWLISNGMPCIRHEAEPGISRLNAIQLNVEEFHLNDIVDFCLDSTSRRNSHQFNARDSGVLETTSYDLRAIIGYISAGELIRLLGDIRDPSRLDYSVFDMNVRGFLGLKGSVNKEIFASATAPDNSRFFALNNGITMVGEQCKVNRSTSDAPRIGVRKLSIVNGAQTCSAIFDAFRDFQSNADKFARLSVLFRLFETQNPDLISSISISTNNQNRIHPRDLKANDPAQIRLETELARRDIRYRRRRGDFANPPDSREELDALLAGQIILSYILLDPTRARRDSDGIFQQSYQKVFHSVNVDHLIEGLRWFQLIDRRRQAVLDGRRNIGDERENEDFIVYGVFHTLMLCSLIGSGMPGDDADRVIDEAMEYIGQLVAERPRVAYYSLFRDQGTADRLKEMVQQPRLI